MRKHRSLQHRGSLWGHRRPRPGGAGNRGACHSLGQLSRRQVSVLDDALNQRVGATVSLDGGDACGPIQRSISIDVLCSDSVRPANITIVESTERICLYRARVESRAGCPTECNREPATGAVCGGIRRGACRAESRSTLASCVCKAGFAGPLCEPSGAEDSINIVFPIFVALFGFVCISVTFMYRPHFQKLISLKWQETRLSVRATGLIFILSLALLACYELQSQSSGVTTLDVIFSTSKVFSNSSRDWSVGRLRPSGHPIGELLCDHIGTSLHIEKTDPGVEFNEASLAGVAGRFKEIYERSQWGRRRRRQRNGLHSRADGHAAHYHRDAY
jgi:hypothetical protein